MSTTRAGFELCSGTYHPESGTHRSGYDLDATPPSMAVVAALSEVTGIDPLELGPLGASVDTDTLDAPVRVRDASEGDLRVTFPPENRTVTVASDDVVTVGPSGGGRVDERDEEGRHE